MTKEKAIEFGNMWFQMNEDCKDSDTYSFFKIAIKALKQSRWIPVNDPLNELPKNKKLLVTVEEEIFPGKKCRYVTELYYDMTEWSDVDDAENAVAYQYYPEPYDVDSDD